MRELWKRKVLEPLARQLTQGATPRQLALALALGLTVGALPALGLTTLACALLALALRLNQPAIQVANYAGYPLQLGLYLPFFHAGAWLFGRPRESFTLAEIQAAVAADPWGTVARYAGANLRAVAAWAAVAPVAVLALFLVLRPLLERVARARRAATARIPSDR